MRTGGGRAGRGLPHLERHHVGHRPERAALDLEHALHVGMELLVRYLQLTDRPVTRIRPPVVEAIRGRAGRALVRWVERLTR